MKELMISLDGKNGRPMYEQIYEYIRDEIQKGNIRAGEKLPSTRQLSAHLGISRSTADQAYQQLMAEGYITSLPWKGYYACELDQLYQYYQLADRPDDEKKDSKEETHAEKQFLYDFALNGIAQDGFPYHTWRKISKNVLNEDDGTLFQLGENQGQWELRREITTYLHHARGVNCKPEQIIVGAGNDYLLMLLQVILGTGWKIAMDDPTYLSAYQAFKTMGYQMCSLKPDGMGMIPEMLEKSEADIAYVMPSHQFPLGSVMPVKRRQELLAWAAKKDNRYIIEDDYDSEFRYRGKPIPSLQGFDNCDRVIYLGTFSKSLAPAIRISYMVLPWKLLELYEKKAKNFSVTVSRVDQKILEVFLKDGYFERHLNRMRGIYRGKHDRLVSELKKISDLCHVEGEHAGVHLLVVLHCGMTEKEAVERAKSEGIKIYGLSEFGVKKENLDSRPTVLLGYATLSEDEITEAVKELEKSWRRADEIRK